MQPTEIDIAKAWRDEKLIRIGNKDEVPSWPDSTTQFLSQFGLPSLVQFVHPTITANLSFGPLAFQILSMKDLEVHGGVPEEWEALYVIGKETFTNGAADWCIDRSSGALLRIDIELDNPIAFVNSSVQQFARTLILWKSVSRSGGALDIETVCLELARLDENALQPRGFWTRFAAEVKEFGSAAVFIE